MTTSLRLAPASAALLCLGVLVLSGCSVIVKNETDCNVEQDCNDDNPCTVDTCGSDNRCHNDPLDCDDGNGCTEDGCSTTTGECVHVTKTCVDGDACTIDGCDTSNGACTFTFHDNDKDGYAPEASCTPTATGDAGVPMELGGDCDDANSQVNPGAPESCSTTYDDNCNGSTTDWVSSTVWYGDKDGDGYPNTADTTTNCSAPSGYIALRADGKTDCADLLATVNPGNSTGSGQYFCRKSLNDNLPYYATCPAGYSPSWDYDCDGSDEQAITGVNATTCPCFTFCSKFGGCFTSCWSSWSNATAPACGAYGSLWTYANGSCSSYAISTQQACY